MQDCPVEAAWKTLDNAIAPGLIDTAQPRSGNTEEEIQAMSRKVPLGHMGEPGDVAAAALFFPSDDSRHITGQVLDVNGGSSMG